MSVYIKLLEIQNHITGLSKDKKGDGRFTFDYLTGDKLLSHVRPKMNELKLILKQEVLDLDNERIDYKTKTGEKSEVLYKAKMRFTWIDAETGEKDENMFYGTGMNNWEKGYGSCLTYAERYFLLKYFHIPTDKDDVDNRPSTDWSGTTTTTTTTTSKASEKQIGAINSILNKASNKDEWLSWIRETYLVEIDQLGKKEASEVIKKLKGE